MRKFTVALLSFFLAVEVVLGVRECRFNSQCSGTEECACKRYVYRRGRNGGTYRDYSYNYCCSRAHYYGIGGIAGLIAIIAVISILVGCYCYKRQCGNKLRRGTVVPVPLATSVNSSEKNVTPDPHHVHIPPENKVPMTAAPAYTAYPSPTGSAAPPPPYPAFPASGSPAGYPT